MASKDLNIKITTTSDNKGVQQTKAGLEGVEKSSQIAAKDIAGLTKESQLLSKGLSLVGVEGTAALTAIGVTASVAAGALVGVGIAVVALTKQLIDAGVALVKFAEPGADFNVLKQNFDDLFGPNAQENLADFRKALAGNLADTEVIKLANSFKLLGANSDQITQVFDIVERISDFTGDNIETSAEKLKRFFATGKDKSITDALKINRQELLQTAAELGGITTSRLKDVSDETRAELLLQAALKLRGDTLDNIRQKSLDEGDAIATLSTEYENAKVKVQAFVSTAIAPAITAFISIIEKIKDFVLSIVGGQEGFDKFKNKIVEGVQSIVNFVVPKIESLIELFKKFFDEIKSTFEQFPALIKIVEAFVDANIKLFGKLATDAANSLGVFIQANLALVNAFVKATGVVVGIALNAFSALVEGAKFVTELLNNIPGINIPTGGFDAIVGRIKDLQTQTSKGAKLDLIQEGVRTKNSKTRLGNEAGITEEEEKQTKQKKQENDELEKLLETQRKENDELDRKIDLGKAFNSDKDELNKKHLAELNLLSQQNLSQEQRNKLLDETKKVQHEIDKSIQSQLLKQEELNDRIKENISKNFIDSIIDNIKFQNAFNDLGIEIFGNFGSNDLGKVFNDIDSKIDSFKEKIRDLKFQQKESIITDVITDEEIEKIEELNDQIELSKEKIKKLTGEERVNEELNLALLEGKKSAITAQISDRALFQQQDTKEYQTLLNQTKELEKQREILKEAAREEWGKKIFGSVTGGINQFSNIVKDIFGEIKGSFAELFTDIVDWVNRVVNIIQNIVGFIDTIKETVKLIRELNGIDKKGEGSGIGAGGVSGTVGDPVHVWVDNPAEGAIPKFGLSDGEGGRAAIGGPQRAIDITKDKDWNDIIFDVPNGRNKAKSARSKASGAGLSSVIDDVVQSSQEYSDSATKASQALDSSISITSSNLIPAIAGLAGAATGLALLFKGVSEGDAGSVIGGIFTTVLSILPFFLAKGGPVPGVGSSDTVPAMLTPGEFVINKRASQQYYPLLNLINGGSGRLGQLGYAMGGVVGAPNFSSPKVDVVLNTRFEKLDTYKIYVNGKEQADTRIPKKTMG